MLAWKTVAQDLEEKTRNYWKVSRAWNGQSSSEMAFEKANKICSNNLLYTNPFRPVAILTNRLLQELIQDEPSPSPKASSLIEFPNTFEALTFDNIQY